VRNYKTVGAWIAVILVTLTMGCGIMNQGKTVEFTEEVEAEGTTQKILLTRREIFDPRVVDLRIKQLKVASEIQVVNSQVPVWRGNLRPIYFEVLPDRQSYLLVTAIPNALICYERGRPSSQYVIFSGNSQGWREVPAPKYLEGRSANLLLSVEGETLGNKPVTMKLKERLNILSGFLHTPEQTIQLNFKYGC